MVTADTASVGPAGDAADDPAVWRHPNDPAQSLILGTNKQEGLVVYALDGSERQRLAIGPINNVDVRQDPGSAYDIAVASNGSQRISIFSIDRTTAEVTHLNDGPTGKTEPYGICLGASGNAGLAGVTCKDGTIELWELGGRIRWRHRHAAP